MPKSDPSSKPSMFRVRGSSALRQEAIDREARIIRGYAVITRGEALGHYFWIDEEALDQTVEHGNAAARGIKSRFTHPGLSSDGLGKFLGRAKNFRRDGDMVRADLHFSRTTEKAPGFDKDPAEYIMDLAEEDPQAFATSIVFYHDIGAEDRHRAEHTDEGGDFKSPDPKNEKNLEHMRIAELEASDLVDEAAANPGGFFARTHELPARAEEALAWAFGISDRAPSAQIFGGIHPDRVQEFFRSFCARHQIVLNARPAGQDVLSDRQPKEEIMPKEQEELEARLEAERKKGAESAREGLKALRDAFADDPEYAMQAFDRGLTVEAAKAEYSDVLRGRLAESEQARTKAEAELQKLQQAGEQEAGGEGVDRGTQFGGGTEAGDGDYLELVRQYADEHKCSKTAAQKFVRKNHPKAFQAFLAEKKEEADRSRKRS